MMIGRVAVTAAAEIVKPIKFGGIVAVVDRLKPPTQTPFQKIAISQCEIVQTVDSGWAICAVARVAAGTNLDRYEHITVPDPIGATCRSVDSED
jgi:hypothetical protein